MLWPRWIWLRALGVIYLSAFYSLLFQITGLIGPRGISPASDYLQDGLRVWQAPSIFWLGSSDTWLLAVTMSGLAASISLIANFAPRISLIVCWCAFLSFISVSQEFGSYQSDGMLLEAGFISLFLAPKGLRPGLGADDPPSRLSTFLLVWEWFRIYFESGIVKLLSHDPQWANLTAMDHYYENGPLPGFPGWYVQQWLPHAFHAATVVLTFIIELGLVFFAFLPRRFRQICFFAVTPFQLVIILTANYAFLNYLVLFLGIFLLDDPFFRAAAAPAKRASWLERAALGVIFYVTVTVAPVIERTLPRALLWPAIALEPLRIANAYGLFAVMTEDRYEIEFQGSEDGTHYLPYSYRYKPQDPLRAPGLFAPYQPRFEWNLWFASLSDWRRDAWVVNVEARLLQGSPEVLRLFARDPFAGKPPRYVRAVRWQYWFTSRAEKRETGAWWKREERGLYAPELEMRDGTIEAR